MLVANGSRALRCLRLTTAIAEAAASRSLSAQASSGSRSSAVGYVLFVPSAISAGLCYWQFQRKGWKEEVITRKQALAGSAALDLFAAEGDIDAYQPVYAEGRYIHEASVVVGPRPRTVGPNTRQGFTLFTPLVDQDRRRAVLVNRGWIPEDWVESPEVRKGGEPQGRVRVQGVLQPDEQPSSFVPDNDPAQGKFYWVSGADMAEACGLPASTPLLQIISASSKRGEQSLEGEAVSKRPLDPPIAKNPDELLKFSVMPHDHLGYAAVWGSLSASLAYLAARAVRRGR